MNKNNNEDIRPPERAAALSYNENDSAPRVVAKGYGSVAEAIMAKAEEHGLYVHQSTELVDLLMQVDLDERIPGELYQAVAELLAWVYELEHNIQAATLQGGEQAGQDSADAAD